VIEEDENVCKEAVKSWWYLDGVALKVIVAPHTIDVLRADEGAGVRKVSLSIREVTFIGRVHITNAGWVGFQGDVVVRIGVCVLSKLKATWVDWLSWHRRRTELNLRMRDRRIEELYIANLLPHGWRGLVVHTLGIAAREDDLEWEPGTSRELGVGIIVTRENGFADVKFG